MGLTSATARAAVMHPTLGKRARDTETNDDLEMSSSPSKRVTANPPTTPRRTLGRRPKWDVGRHSPRHQIFGTKSTSLDSHGRFARWMEDLEAAFNPSFSPPNNRSPEPLIPCQDAGPPSATRIIRRAVSPRTPSVKPRSRQAELEAFREERRESGKIDSRRAMVEDRIPQIGEDELDFLVFHGEELPNSSAASTTSKKRGAEEALDEAMPDAPDHVNTTSPQPAKRHRSNSVSSSSAGTSTSHSTSAQNIAANSPSTGTSTSSSTSAQNIAANSPPVRTSSSSSASARRLASSSSSARTSTSSSTSPRRGTSSSPIKKSIRKSKAAAFDILGFKFPPTIREIEWMEYEKRRPSPKATFMDRVYHGEEKPITTKLGRKIDGAAEKLRSLSLEDLKAVFNLPIRSLRSS
ncbi:MAG: hypothetical protein Q9226_004232 [Calogaya cf. arnoldii]